MKNFLTYAFGCGKIGHILEDSKFVSEIQMKLQDQPYGTFIKPDS